MEQQLQQLSGFYKNNPKLLIKYRGTYVMEWGWLMYLEKDSILAEKMCMVNDLRFKYNMRYHFDTRKNKGLFKVNPAFLVSVSKCPKRFVI